MNPESYFTRGLILPELKLNFVDTKSPAVRHLHLSKERKGAVCTRCASFSNTLYDKRVVTVRDEPLQGKLIVLHITKHRYFCKTCKKPFTEPVPGILPGRKTTQRLRKSIYWACENFVDLKSVCKAYRVSQGFVHLAYYEQLGLREKKHNRYPFSERIGIDEHVFGRKKALGSRQFVTMLVDHNNKKLRDVAVGKTKAELTHAFSRIPNPENVKLVTLDLSDSYKSFVRDFFPNAKMIADRFHVQRLITPILNSARIEITGDKRKHPVRLLMLRSRRKLKYYERSALDSWLRLNPKINEIYQFKEAIARFYNLRGFKRAEIAFNKLILELSKSMNPQLLTLRNTFLRWRKEILNFFIYRLTNARVEGFNNVAKVIKRRAYGFRSIDNYKLRLLNACS